MISRTYSTTPKSSQYETMHWTLSSSLELMHRTLRLMSLLLTLKGSWRAHHYIVEAQKHQRGGCKLNEPVPNQYELTIFIQKLLDSRKATRSCRDSGQALRLQPSTSPAALHRSTHHIRSTSIWGSHGKQTIDHKCYGRYRTRGEIHASECYEASGT